MSWDFNRSTKIASQASKCGVIGDRLSCNSLKRDGKIETEMKSLHNKLPVALTYFETVDDGAQRVCIVFVAQELIRLRF